MNSKRPRLLIVLSVIMGSLISVSRIAQTQQPRYSDFGGGEYTLNLSAPHINEVQRQRVQAEIERNIKRLQLNTETFIPSESTLSWPLQSASWLDDYGYHGISNFVDHDTAYPDHLLDYNCGERTYDTASGYNHTGTDFFTWPFSWNKMDQNAVEVIAAASGIIVYKEDGHADRNCAPGQGDANLITVLHGDGSTALYVHFKKWSLTSKAVGAMVSKGEYLGVVGSSGNSTGPHLHFEVYNANDPLNPIDPYQGSCNSTISKSWWVEQRPYYDSAINRLTTGNAEPDLPDCDPETPHEQTVFVPGDTLYFTAYYRDQLASLPSQYTIRKPDGSVYNSWTHSMPDKDHHYAASYWWWSFTLGENVPLGTWRFEVVFNGQSYNHDFYVIELSNFLYLPLVKK